MKRLVCYAICLVLAILGLVLYIRWPRQSTLGREAFLLKHAVVEDSSDWRHAAGTRFFYDGMTYTPGPGSEAFSDPPADAVQLGTLQWIPGDTPLRDFELVGSDACDGDEVWYSPSHPGYLLRHHLRSWWYMKTWQLEQYRWLRWRGNLYTSVASAADAPQSYSRFLNTLPDFTLRLAPEVLLADCIFLGETVVESKEDFPIQELGMKAELKRYQSAEVYRHPDYPNLLIVVSCDAYGSYVEAYWRYGELAEEDFVLVEDPAQPLPDWYDGPGA